MKTLVKDGLSLYVFEDDKVLDITASNVQVGEPLEFTILDCNSSNVTLHTDVTPPADWAGCKYNFDGTSWTANSDWEEPEEVVIP